MEIGRNDFCSCGSGKRYKKCCLFNIENNPEWKKDIVFNVLEEAPFMKNFTQKDKSRLRLVYGILIKLNKMLGRYEIELISNNKTEIQDTTQIHHICKLFSKSLDLEYEYIVLQTAGKMFFLESDTYSLEYVSDKVWIQPNGDVKILDNNVANGVQSFLFSNKSRHLYTREIQDFFKMFM